MMDAKTEERANFSTQNTGYYYYCAHERHTEQRNRNTIYTPFITKKTKFV